MKSSHPFQAVETVRWKDESVRLLDQTALPAEETYLELRSVDEVIDAIYRLAVRGAPAIGIAGAYGVAVAALHASTRSVETFLSDVESEAKRITAARPTAVNLSWAVERTLRSMCDEAEKNGASKESADCIASIRAVGLVTADEILAEDLECSAALSKAGADLLEPDCRVLTHCNTGALATGGGGTALGVVFEAARQGKNPFVFVDETRPLLQGARLTAWELDRAGIDYQVQCDGAAAWALATQKIDAVFVGSDRVAANGDAANKIGTLGVAIAAAHFDVPFYVVAPRSTFDFAAEAGADIPVEQRAREEVVRPLGQWIAPQTADAFNPAFDVTPASLIRGWVTERGVETPPFDR